jgi:hypothetical protein
MNEIFKICTYGILAIISALLNLFLAVSHFLIPELKARPGILAGMHSIGIILVDLH